MKIDDIVNKHLTEKNLKDYVLKDSYYDTMGGVGDAEEILDKLDKSPKISSFTKEQYISEAKMTYEYKGYTIHKDKKRSKTIYASVIEKDPLQILTSPTIKGIKVKIDRLITTGMMS